MILSFPGGKRNSASSAERRFNPANGRLAVGTKPLLLSFRQECFAAITLGRQEELKEGLQERDIHLNEKGIRLERGEDGGDAILSPLKMAYEPQRWQWGQ